MCRRSQFRSYCRFAKERVNTIEELADAAVYFLPPLDPTDELKAQHFNTETKFILTDLIEKFKHIEWTREFIHHEIKQQPRIMMSNCLKLQCR